MNVRGLAGAALVAAIFATSCASTASYDFAPESPLETSPGGLPPVQSTALASRALDATPPQDDEGGGDEPVLEPGQETLPDRRFAIGLGVGFARFDANVKFTDDEGRSAFIDMEGTIGLPDRDLVPLVFGRYSFTRRHAIGFSAMSISREATVFDQSIALGDFTVDGEATLTDSTNFYALNYAYTLLQDPRSRLLASFGLYGLDLEYILELEGQIEFRGQPIASQNYEAKAGVFAPLPMFGIDATFALTRRWSISTNFKLVGGSFQDVSATVLDTAILAHFEMGKHVGLLLGINYFNADVKVDKDDLRTEVAYGFDGFYLGLNAGF